MFLENHINFTVVNYTGLPESLKAQVIYLRSNIIALGANLLADAPEARCR
jgi:hypothetical protein